MPYDDLDKEALKTNAYTVLAKLYVLGTDVVFTEDDCIVDWNYEDYRYVPNNGFIGQFVEKILDGTLRNVPSNITLDDKEIGLEIGIVNNLNLDEHEQPITTWYYYGDFLVTKFQREDTTGKCKFEACDFAKKFNKVFETSYEYTSGGQTQTKTLSFPCTAGELAQFVCEEVGVDFDYNSTSCLRHIVGEDGLPAGDYCFKKSGSTYYKFTTTVNLDKNSVITYNLGNNQVIVRALTHNNNVPIITYYTLTSSSGSKSTYQELTPYSTKKYTFTNEDFVIESNQYDSDATCRKVIQDIAKLAYSWARINYINRLFFDFTPMATTDVDQYDELTTDEYYISKKNDLPFGPVNKVLIGMSNVDGENMYKTSQDYTPETECAIKIWDNNLTNTDELRAIALYGAERLFGITYTPMEIDTVGHPWLEGDELIKLTNVDGEVVYTYPFNRSIKYNGVIEGKISSETGTVQENKYEYTSDIISSVRKTAIEVDKENQRITALAEDVSENTSNISTLNITVGGIETRVQSIETTEVTAVTNEYAVNTDPDNPPAQSSSSWSTTQPTRGTGEYIWARIKTTYKSGNVDYSDPVNTTGDKGDPGQGGKGISSIDTYYKTTSTQTEPSAASITSTTIPTMDDTNNKYLWQKTVTNYTTGNPDTAVALIGIYGDKGTPAENPQSNKQVEGTDFSLSDASTSNLVKDATLNGQTSQTTIDGRNLIDGANPTDYNLATSTFSNDIIKVSSTATNTTPYARWVIDNLASNDVVRYSAIIQNSNGQVSLQYDNNGTWTTINNSVKTYSDGTTPATYTWTNNLNTTKVRFLLYANKVIPTGNSESSYKNVIVTKNNSDLTYVPYVGGVPSPNPSYPQPVNVVSGDNSIEVCGKNLFDESIILNATGWTKPNEYYTGQVNYLRTYLSGNRDIIKFKENTQYTFSWTGYLGTAVNVRMVFVYTDGTSSSGAYITSTTEASSNFTTTSGKTLSYILLDYSTSGSIFIKNIQLEANTTKTNYEPYVGTSYPIYLGVDNLFDINSVNEKKGIDSSGNLGNNNNLSTSDYIYIEPNTSYYLTNTIGSTYGRCCAYYNDSKTFISAEGITGGDAINTSITTPTNAKYMRVACAYGNENILKITKGSTPQYISDAPIELCKIGTYQDMIFKNTLDSPYYDSNFDVDKWLLHKEIGKTILSSSNSFSLIDNTSYSSTILRFQGTINDKANGTGSLVVDNILCNRFTCKALDASGTRTSNSITGQNATKLVNVFIDKTLLATPDVSGFNTYLGNNNTEVYYVLATPTTTLITDETLISQLDEFCKSYGYDNQTNIVQMNNDLPFYIKLDYWTVFKGETGSKGDTGDDGASVNTITEYYAVSDSNETPPSTWTTDLSSIELTHTNRYLWNYEVITYTEGKQSTETGKKVIGVYGDTGDPADPAIMYLNDSGTIIDTEIAGNIELKSINEIDGNTKQDIPILPSGYTQVEYIESSGTQYIDTGYKFNKETDTIEMTLNFTRQSGSKFPFGTYATDSYLGLNYYGTDTTMMFYNSSGSSAGSFTYDGNGVKARLKVTPSKIYINDVEKLTVTSVTGTTALNIFLFAASTTASSAAFQSKMKLYGCKITSGTTLKRNFVPCYRNSDNVIGLYDLVNGVFYTNAGTGTFTKGSNTTLPTPDYPVEVQTVTGKQDIIICGKNISPVNSKIITGTTSSTSAIGSIADTILVKDILVEPNQTYIVSCIKPSQISTLKVFFYNKPLNATAHNNAYVELVNSGRGIEENVVATGNQNTNYQYMAVSTGNTSTYSASATVTINITDLMIRKEGTSSDYETYVSNACEVNLGKNLLFVDANNITASNWLAFNQTTQTFTIKAASGVAPVMIPINIDVKVGDKLTTTIYFESGQYTSGSISLGAYHNGSPKSWQGEVAIPKNTDLSGKTYKTTFTVTENINGFFPFIYNSPTISTNMVFTVQIEKGNQSSEYRPYFTPIELCKIDDVKDKIYKGRGVNLLDISSANTYLNACVRNTDGSIRSNINDGYYSYITIYYANDIILKNKGNMITFSVDKGVANRRCSIIIFGTRTSGAQLQEINGTYGERYVSGPIADDFTSISYVELRFNRYGSKHTDTTTIFYDFQLEIGELSSYEPYNAKDKWILNKNITKIILDGVTAGRKAGNTYTYSDMLGVSFFGIIPYNGTRLHGISNMSNKFTQYVMNSIWLGVGNNAGYWVGVLDELGLTTYQDFNTWLQSHNVTIYYISQVPSYTFIDNQYLIDDLSNLEKTKLNEGVNHIAVDGNLPMYLDLDYWTWYKGETGKGVGTIIEEYALSTSSTTVTGTWSTTAPTMTSTNKYLWNRTTTVFENPTTVVTSDPILIGVYGLTGDTGKGITSVTELYYVSNSSTAPAKPTEHVTTASLSAYNAWNLQCPPYTTTYKYFYTCSEILYTDNTYGWSNVTQNQGLAIANQNAKTAVDTVNSMEIGGRNYILGSKDLILNNLGSATGSRKEYGFLNVGQSYMTLAAGTQVTISFDIEMVVATANPSLMVYNSNNKGPKQIGSKSIAFTAAVGTTIKKRVNTVTNIMDRQDATLSSNFIEFYSTYGTNNFFKITNLKLEIGNKATDWTVAPEDVEEDISSIAHSLSSYVTTQTYTAGLANTSEELKSWSREELVTTGDFGTYQQYVSGQLSQKAGVTEISSTATQIVNDAMSGISDTISNVEETFTFDTNGLKIARGGNSIYLQLQNDELAFRTDSTDAGRKAYMSSDAFVLDQLKELRIGNFGFKVRTNGSVDFKKVK